MCWNCDRPAHEVVTVTLGGPPGGQVTVALCRACYALSHRHLANGTAEPTPGRARAVLVVDDDPDILAMLCQVFRDEGYAVDAAEDGQEALHKACSRLPDIVVLDLRMPVLDGRSFIAAWRQITAAAPVPIVAISAQSRLPTAEELGVEAVLPKPFDLGALVRTVSNLLNVIA